jgi:hypothetical protein
MYAGTIAMSKARLTLLDRVRDLRVSRVLQEVRHRCAEIEEELGDGCDPDPP